MKILNVFNHYLDAGGEAQAVKVIADSLAEVVELRRCEFSSADWVGPDAPPKWQQALRMISNPTSLQRLREFEGAAKSDAWLVHNVYPVGSAAVYREAMRLGIPIIQYLHNYRPLSVDSYLWVNNQVVEGSWSSNYWKEIRFGTWQKSRAKTAWFAVVLTLTRALGWWGSIKAYIAISEFLRQKFIAAGVPAGDIFTLRHFWNPRPAETPSEGEHYLFLGRLVEAKGVHVLLDAWELLEKERGARAPRLVIGGDGPLRDTLQARAERMSSVSLAGAISGSAKEEALRNARAVVVPSVSWEGLGLTVYEAYDYLQPVLAARSGGIGESVVHGETGLLHQPGAAAELAAQVVELESDSAKRRAMGEAGRVWLEENTREADWQRRFLEIAAHARR